MFEDLLMKYYHFEDTPRKPDAIVYYRDGVSEAQYNEVMAKEYAQIKLTIAKIQKDLNDTWEPTVTIVIVQKRHHLRMFQADASKLDKSGNAQPGTVIDSGVTHPLNHDFYLQSHAGIQGTSRPTHYTVLVDELGFSADEIQTLTFELCHVYQRCSRSVSIPTPVYYAHLAAFRARALYNRHMVLSTGEIATTQHSGFATSKKLKPGDDYKPAAKKGRGAGEHDSESGMNSFAGIHTNIKDAMFFC